jgi:hypothetical protein
MMMFASSVIMTHGQGLNSTRVEFTDPYVKIGCCDLLVLLSTYMIHSTGDKITLEKCREHENECLELKLIHRFYQQTHSLLHTTNSDDSTYKDQTHLLISKSALLTRTDILVVLAFLGRSVASDQGLIDKHLSLEYDSTTDNLSVRDSACAMNKTIYSTIVLASIALVVFFISMQVIESEKIKRKEAIHSVTPVPIEKQALQSAMRLRSGYIGISSGR